MFHVKHSSGASGTVVWLLQGAAAVQIATRNRRTSGRSLCVRTAGRVSPSFGGILWAHHVSRETPPEV